MRILSPRLVIRHITKKLSLLHQRVVVLFYSAVLWEGRKANNIATTIMLKLQVFQHIFLGRKYGF